VSDGTPMTDLIGHGDDVRTAVFSPDGARILTSSADGTARLWDANARTEAIVLQGHTAKVTSATFSHDGALAVTASADSTARLWDAKTGRPSHVLRHDGVVTSAVFSPDDRLVLTGSADLTARLWDVQSGAQRAVLGGHDGGVAATFSPDGRLVATASTDGTTRLWETSTGRLLGSPIIQRTGVREALISPDGQRLVTVGSCEARERTQVCENVARLWLVDGKTPLGEMRGHTGRLNSATFSLDGAVVVTASEDRTARVWEANTGRRLLDLIGHTEAVTSAALSADGKLIVTASEDESARIFACEVCVSADELITLARRRLTRRLTEQERTQYGLPSDDDTTFFGRVKRAVVPVS
jgi:WD40 repeat protein